MGSRLKRLRLAAAHSLTPARLRAEKQKCFALYLRLRAQTLRGFFDRLQPQRFSAAAVGCFEGVVHRAGASGDKFPGGVLRQCDAALIHNALVFLFQLEKRLAARLGHAVAAQPQLFLVRRLFERGADEPVIGRIVIYIADGALAMLIRNHPRIERGLERCALRVRDAVFELPPFKSISVHGGVSFALMVLLYGDFLKSS